MEPDVPGSEDLPLRESEGPAAHAEAMVHFQSRLSGRLLKHQARPSNLSAAERSLLGSCTGSHPAPSTAGSGAEETHVGKTQEGKCRVGE